MSKTVLVVVAMVVMAGVACAQCPAPVPPGTEVEIRPSVVVVSMEMPTMPDGCREVRMHRERREYANNRSVSMVVMPYPPQGTSVIGFVLEEGFGNPDKEASVDLKIVGPGMRDSVPLKRMGPGQYFGEAEFPTGWNEARVWVTTPTTTHYTTFNFWAGPYSEKPRNVAWMCPRHRMVTVETSCPLCRP